MKFVLDSHNHTLASVHAYSTLLEVVGEARRKGLELVAITDHAPAMPGAFHELHFSNFRVIPEEIDGVKVMMGTELNIVDKNAGLDLPERILKQLSPIIASLHYILYKFEKEEMTDEEKQQEITETLLKVMDNPYVNIIGHPGDPQFPFDVDKIVRKSLETGTLLEMNNSNLNPKSFRAGSEKVMMELLLKCKEINCPIVVGTDAHISFATGDFNYTYDLLKKADFPERLVANCSVDYFLSLLDRKKIM